MAKSPRINPTVCIDVFAEVGAVGGLSAVEFGLMRILVIYEAIAIDVAEEQSECRGDGRQGVALVVSDGVCRHGDESSRYRHAPR